MFWHLDTSTGTVGTCTAKMGTYSDTLGTRTGTMETCYTGMVGEFTGMVGEFTGMVGTCTGRFILTHMFMRAILPMMKFMHNQGFNSFFTKVYAFFVMVFISRIHYRRHIYKIDNTSCCSYFPN